MNHTDHSDRAPQLPDPEPEDLTGGQEGAVSGGNGHGAEGYEYTYVIMPMRV